ncbi:Uncharacterised protein [Enterobacter cancerogenus]|uniref:Uncharacterized protein n=1 Tax=Enterobacter cancerogenus TaxID=69218 RepID=A0A484XJ54_9ENTR|nr:Uncharacterised protein [Enterobacter cancerogenus]
MLNTLQATFFHPILVEDGRLFFDDEQARQVGEHPGVGLHIFGQLIELLPLLNGLALNAVGMGRHQHDDAGGEGQTHPWRRRPSL